MAYKYYEVEHMFGQNQTVDAVLRKYNVIDIKGVTLTWLRKRFYEINPEIDVPRAGQKVKIPVREDLLDQRVISSTIIPE